MRKDIFIGAVLLICAIAFFSFNLGSLSYLKGDENYYFQGARRMIRDGDWITPRYHHRIRFEKPPLYYWLVAGSFKVFGVRWPAARFTSSVLGGLVVLMVYFMAMMFFGRRGAVFSVLALATNEMFFRYSRLCVSDITFLFLITLALFLFLKSYKTKAGFYFTLSFIPMGLAVLTKGPIGPILILLTLIAFISKEKNNRGSTSIINMKNLALGVALFLAVTLPWVLAMIRIHGDAFLGHIWSTEIVDKATWGPGTIGSIRHYIKNLGYYVPVAVFSFLPWSIFLPFALFSKKDPARREGNHFTLSWFWVVFIFFSAVGFKHTHYMLALSPALAMIVGTYLAGVSVKKPRFKKFVVGLWILSLVSFLTFTGFILPYLDDGAMRVFSLKIATEIKKNDRIGMASRKFNIKKLGIHLNNLISSPYELSGDDLAQYVRIDKKNNLISFLNSDKRVFVFITESDYLKYVPLELRRKSYILEKHMVWKKIRVNNELSESILSGDLRRLKERSYLISNQN